MVRADLMPRWFDTYSELPPRLVGGLRNLDTMEVFVFRRIRHLGLIPKRTMTIGRGPGCDIRIEDDHVSERHGTLRRQSNGGYLLEDERSRNGIWVRDPLELGAHYRKVSWVALTLGLHLRVGSTRLLVADTEGFCVISASNSEEFCSKALRIYGSPEAAYELAGVELDLAAAPGSMYS